MNTKNTPEADLLVAICHQAADDFITWSNELGIARLRGNPEEIQKIETRVREARSFFENGNARAVVNADDKAILRGLDKKVAELRRWMTYSSWDDVMEDWSAVVEKRNEEAVLHNKHTAEWNEAHPDKKPRKFKALLVQGKDAWNKALSVWLGQKMDEDDDNEKYCGPCCAECPDRNGCPNRIGGEEDDED